jgi:hypothetical protein
MRICRSTPVAWLIPPPFCATHIWQMSSTSMQLFRSSQIVPEPSENTALDSPPRALMSTTVPRTPIVIVGVRIA